MEEEQYHGKMLLTGIFTIVIIVFIVLIGIVLVVMRARTASLAPSTSQAESTSPAQTASVGAGDIYLEKNAGKSVYHVGETVTLDIFMSSDAATVVAYDVELLFGSQASFISAKSLIPSYDVRSTVKGDRVFLTGFKKAGDSLQSPFLATPVAQMTFSFEKSGIVSFTPQFVAGQTVHSNIVNTESKNVLGRVRGLEIVVN